LDALKAEIFENVKALSAGPQRPRVRIGRGSNFAGKRNLIPVESARSALKFDGAWLP
jgi:hypothetical protein